MSSYRYRDIVKFQVFKISIFFEIQKYKKKIF